MSDIEKLNQVINTLEEQSTRVTEFNGILDSVNSSRKQIEASRKQVESAQKLLVNVADEHKSLIDESYKSLEDLSKKLDKQGLLLSTLEHTQKNLQKDIEGLASTLKSVSEKQDSLLSTLRKDIEGLASTLKTTSDKHEYAIDSLQKVLIFGLIFVMVGVVFMNS